MKQDIKYEVVEITERKCSPNIQKDIKKGLMYAVVGTDTLKDGTPVVIVNSRRVKGKTLRLNANRFTWKPVTLEDCKEKQFKKSCQKASEQLRNNFTLREHVQIAIVPCILANIAFRYGDKVRKEAAELRISELKPLSRAYDVLKDSYLKELALDLDKEHIKSIDDQTAQFMKLYNSDFVILGCSVESEFKKKYGNCSYCNLRTDAICGMLLVDMAKQMVSDIDKMIQQRIPTSGNTIFNPKVATLRDIFDAYAGNIEKFYFNDSNCQLAIKVIRNKILQIEFNVE